MNFECSVFLGGDFCLKSFVSRHSLHVFLKLASFRRKIFENV